MYLLIITILLTLAVVSIHAIRSVCVVKYLPVRKLSYNGLIVKLFIVVLFLILLHLIEASFFAVYYYLTNAISTFSISIYYSLVSYTTLGYGDIMPDAAYRIVGGYEGLLGTLMTGWSTALLIKELHTQTIN